MLLSYIIRGKCLWKVDMLEPRIEYFIILSMSRAELHTGCMHNANVIWTLKNKVVGVYCWTRMINTTSICIIPHTCLIHPFVVVCIFYVVQKKQDQKAHLTETPRSCASSHHGWCDGDIQSFQHLNRHPRGNLPSLYAFPRPGNQPEVHRR